MFAYYYTRCPRRRVPTWVALLLVVTESRLNGNVVHNFQLAQKLFWKNFFILAKNCFRKLDVISNKLSNCVIFVQPFSSY